MNQLTNNQTTSKKPSTAWSKIKTLLSAKAPKMENEIDYYHQYIFPHKANKLLKEQKNPKSTSYVPFAKRKSQR